MARERKWQFSNLSWKVVTSLSRQSLIRVVKVAWWVGLDGGLAFERPFAGCLNFR